MAVFGAGVEVLMQTHPEFFGPERPAVYRQLPTVNTAFRPRWCVRPDDGIYLFSI